MAFTTAAEITFINQVLDRIGASQITLADQTSVAALVSFRHWTTTLNALVRSYTWPFLTTRDELSQIKTMTLDASPTSAWSVDDTITGVTSGTTATILAVTSDSQYDLSHISGDFTDGETITNATVSKVYYNGVLVTYGSETVYTFSTSSTYQINCATGYPVVAVKTPDYEWDYQYELPADFMRLIDVYEDDGSDAPYQRWTREGNRILTDYDSCSIRYVQSVTDPGDFDPLFAEVLLLRMAWKLIPLLAGSLSKTNRESIQSELQTVEAKARTVCGQENNQTGRMDLSLARYGS
jgi:hypothetical protein